MLVLKKKHDLVVEENRVMESEIVKLENMNGLRCEIIKELESALEKEKNIHELQAKVIEKLELKNCKLNTKLIAEEEKVRQLEEANHELHMQVTTLEEDAKKNKKTMDALGRIYNAMNRKLWANSEAQRQIRNLSDNILESERINKASLSKYLWDLSMLIGGGEAYEYAGLTETKEEVVG